jgi:hypothetical protein
MGQKTLGPAPPVPKPLSCAGEPMPGSRFDTGGHRRPGSPAGQWRSPRAPARALALLWRRSIMTNLASNLADTTRAHAGRMAVRVGDATMTYRELDEASAGVAGLLHGRGLKPGDRGGGPCISGSRSHGQRGPARRPAAGRRSRANGWPAARVRRSGGSGCAAMMSAMAAATCHRYSPPVGRHRARA